MNTRVSQIISFTTLSLGMVGAIAALWFVNAGSNQQLASQLDSEAIARQYVSLAEKNLLTADPELYKPREAIRLYKKALSFNPDNGLALYQLIRTYSVIGDYKNAIAYAQRYAEKYPQDPRMLYTAGLAHGFAGDYATSASLLEKYVESKDSSWQSRLDLAWAHYQQGNYSEAKDAIDDAVSKFGDNAWLNISRGAVESALGNNEAAKDALVKAKEQVAAITENDWNRNYSFNGPGHFKIGITQLQKVIDINLAVAEGKNIGAERSNFTKMVGFAPEGGKGLVVSACGESCTSQVCQSAPNSCGATQSWTVRSCVDSHGVPTANNQSCSTNPLPPPAVPARYGQACTSVNLCGIQATGTVQCDGRCSALAPLPPSFGQGCTIRNRCGSATGVVGCNGQCNVARYPTCRNPNDDDVTGGDDGWTEVTINDDDRFRGQNYGNVGVKITAVPSLVRVGQRVVVRWNSFEMTSCEITGSNGDNWTGLQGEEVTRPITLRTTYTISCTAFDGRTLTDTAVVGVTPTVCEIGQVGCER